VRIIAGAWRGRRLIAPADSATRPTADRVRQALFDMLLHAPWGGREIMEDALVIDAFAGTGAFGLEALSRGAAHATFIEQNRAALAALHANIAALHAEARSEVLAVDVLDTPSGRAAQLVFLDPPYYRDLVPHGLLRLRAVGRLVPGALIAVETARTETMSGVNLLAERIHGAARLSVWREA
jgi:16S rRNA (guanine966-N2)-methyltransferase